MSRIIKFRAWDGETMAYQQSDNWFKPNLNTDKRKSQSLSLSVVFLQKCITMMQFTGLSDKNGKDVYEGDLVSWKHLDNKPYEVYYNSEECHFFARHKDPDETESYLDSKKMEVIGNIHENPELLTD